MQYVEATQSAYTVHYRDYSVRRYITLQSFKLANAIRSIYGIFVGNSQCSINAKINLLYSFNLNGRNSEGLEKIQ